MGQFESAGSILDRLTQRMGISTRIEQEKALLYWREAVGETVARRAKARSIKGGILFVAVQDSVWMQELSLLKERIIEKLNSLIGKTVVKEIVFKLGDINEE